ncbi:unnamed protein product [Paramecium sonneborni]|uniref:Uncharacterized protein n=1 Tax=Paramecium sonneborni TaxID=65129 RepID=A0A8S1LK94_9CILI|nr:unnamed protein product [Paramecium sonneborni]
MAQRYFQLIEVLQCLTFLIQKIPKKCAYRLIKIHDNKSSVKNFFKLLQAYIQGHKVYHQSIVNYQSSDKKIISQNPSHSYITKVLKSILGEGNNIKNIVAFQQQSEDFYYFHFTNKENSTQLKLFIIIIDKLNN